MFRELNNFFLADGSKTGPTIKTSTNKVEGGTVYEEIKSQKKRLEVLLKSPALLRVIWLQANLFSMGKFYLYDDKGKEVVEHPLLDLLRQPNEEDDQSQLLFEWMFWNCFGDSYLYVHTDDYDSEDCYLKVLNNTLIDFPNEFFKKNNRIVRDKDEIKKKDKTIRYFFNNDNEYELLRWYRVLHNPNTLTMYRDTEGLSKIDVLYKQITNADKATDSKNVNVRFSSRYLVAGKGDVNNVDEIPLTDDEARDIVRKANRGQAVQAVKNMIDIKRYVEDIAKLKLDDSFMSDYQFIGFLFDIPKDILEAFQSATYENQSEASARLIELSMQPKSEKLCGKLSKYFGLKYEGLNLVMSYDHLSFMQEFYKKMFELKKSQVEAFAKLMQIGVEEKSANAFLDTNFKIKKQKQNEQETTTTETTSED